MLVVNLGRTMRLILLSMLASIAGCRQDSFLDVEGALGFGPVRSAFVIDTQSIAARHLSYDFLSGWQTFGDFEFLSGERVFLSDLPDGCRALQQQQRLLQEARSTYSSTPETDGNCAAESAYWQHLALEPLTFPGERTLTVRPCGASDCLDEEFSRRYEPDEFLATYAYSGPVHPRDQFQLALDAWDPSTCEMDPVVKSELNEQMLSHVELELGRFTVSRVESDGSLVASISGWGWNSAGDQQVVVDGEIVAERCPVDASLSLLLPPWLIQ